MLLCDWLRVTGMATLALPDSFNSTWLMSRLPLTLIMQCPVTSSPLLYVKFGRSGTRATDWMRLVGCDDLNRFMILFIVRSNER